MADLGRGGAGRAVIVLQLRLRVKVFSNPLRRSSTRCSHQNDSFCYILNIPQILKMLRGWTPGLPFSRGISLYLFPGCGGGTCVISLKGGWGHPHITLWASPSTTVRTSLTNFHRSKFIMQAVLNYNNYKIRPILNLESYVSEETRQIIETETNRNIINLY